MSKYVRTKEYIYDLNAKGIRNCVPIEDGKKIKVLQTVLPNGKPVYDALDVLKESDTIKPLCDCWVYINKCLPNSIPKIYYDWDKLFFENQFEEELGIDRDECEVYGAIWTDKGLIYVARKIKEYGEWVLL